MHFYMVITELCDLLYQKQEELSLKYLVDFPQLQGKGTEKTKYDIVNFTKINLNLLTP